MYAINGVFFQQHQSIGVGYRSGDGAVAVVHEGIYYFTFSGLIGPDPNSVIAELIGRSQDAAGYASLSEIEVHEEEILFTKLYDRRGDAIFYRLRKQEDGTWAGTYAGEEAGTGVVRMVLAKLPDDFLDPQAALRLSNQPTLHEWPEGIEP